jgi:hypothetical protein
LQSCYKNCTKTEERQKHAEQTKEEEERASKKIHEKQVVTQRTRMEAGTDDVRSVISSLFPSDLGESSKPDKRSGL